MDKKVGIVFLLFIPLVVLVLLYQKKPHKDTEKFQNVPETACLMICKENKDVCKTRPEFDNSEACYNAFDKCQKMCHMNPQFVYYKN